MLRKFHYLLLLALCACSFVQAQQYYLFVGSYNRDKDKEGIFIYRFNPATGALSPVSTIKDILNPSYLIVSQNGKYIYAGTEAQTPGAGSISSYAFNHADGSVKFIGRRQSGGENPVYLAEHKSGKWLVDACYSGGSAAVFPLHDNGEVGAAAQVITFKDSSVLASRQKSSHIHSSVFSPDHRYVFFPDLGADKIRIYSFKENQSQPLQVPVIPFTRTLPGSGPRHFTFHPNGEFAYSIEELSGYVKAYHYQDGRLDSIQQISAHNGPDKDDFGSADIHTSPDGRFLYATTRGDENIIVTYAIDTKSGRLKRIDSQSTGGKHPRNFVMDPTGKYVLVANQNSNNVIVFERNAQTGLLRKTDISLSMPAPSCLQIKAFEK